MTIITKRQGRLRRRRRVRAKVSGTAARPRLSVYRSNRGVFAQLIDDTQGHTVAAVNWIEPDLRKLTASEQAKKAGELLAERARPLACRPASSIAVATSTTVASRRWPKVRAREGWPSSSATVGRCL